MKNRSRVPRLFVKLPGGEWQQFTGQPIDRIIKVAASSYTKNGKWSGSNYTLQVGSAIVVEVCTPFDGFGDTWSDHAHAIAVLAGEYDRETAARELLPLIDTQNYKSAVERANQNDEVDLV